MTPQAITDRIRALVAETRKPATPKDAEIRRVWLKGMRPAAAEQRVWDVEVDRHA